MADITKGSGNVFEDVGFEPSEAADLRTRTDLMLKLRRFIRSEHWTLAQAALHFEEPESRISHLLDIDIEHFSVEQLVYLLSIAGNPEFELEMRAYDKVAAKYGNALRKLAE
jgi:predicted XRE-type DNA-binding protein